MNTNTIEHIQNRSTTMLKVLNVINWGAIIIFLLLIVNIIRAGFFPAESFHVEQGVANWSMRTDKSNITFLIPFSILQPLSSEMFEAKSAYITYSLFNTLTFMFVLLYGIKQVKDILYSIINSYTPFTIANTTRLRNLAFGIIGYGLFGKLIVNLSVALFVTQIVSITIFEIFNIFSIISGILLLIISHIFKYGVYLQEESDTTL